MSTTPKPLSTLRGTLAEHRARRIARRQLERDLAGYSTPAQRDEIEAILDRYDAEQTRDIRRILDRQARARAVYAGPAARHVA